MLTPTKEYVAVVDLDRARWAQREALVLKVLAARPKKRRLFEPGRALVWLGDRLVGAGLRLQMRYKASHEGAEPEKSVA